MQEHNGHKMPKWLLILCIAAPVVGLASWLLIPSTSTSLAKLLPYALFLLCPLSHFLLMPLMHRSNDHHHSNEQVAETSAKDKPSCH